MTHITSKIGTKIILPQPHTRFGRDSGSMIVVCSDRCAQIRPAQADLFMRVSVIEPRAAACPAHDRRDIALDH